MLLNQPSKQTAVFRPIASFLLPEYFSGSLNVDEKRIMNLLYRNGVFGDFQNSAAVKKVAERKKTGRKPQEHKVENDPNAWSGLFKDNVMQFSPAWFGKNQLIGV